MAKINVLGINHLGLAAKDPVKCRWFIEKVLGLSYLGEEPVLAQKTNTVMFQFAEQPKQSPRLEIVAPLEGTSDGPISKYLEKKGGGIHHIAVSVADIKEAIQHAIQMGVKMIDLEPRLGAHHTKIAFVHPESTGGILVEFVQEMSALD